MRLRINLVVMLCLLFGTNALFAQKDTLQLSLKNAIAMAQRQSLNAFIAKNTYIEGYWNFRTYRSVLYPSLSLDAQVFRYSSGNSWIDANQEFDYRENTTNRVALSIDQNILPTGGTFSLYSDIYRNFNISDGDMQYRTNPVTVSINQPLTGYNRFKWIKKLKPLEYEIKKRQYIRDQQDIAQKTVRVFFDLIAAELDLTISEYNFANADTLYRIGSGRFEIGTITQDELLNLELTRLNAEKSLTSSRLNLQRARTELNSFLRLNDNIYVKCETPKEIPDLEIEVDTAVSLAHENNPQILSYQRSLIQAEQDVANKRADRFNANLRLDYGIDQVAYAESDIYQPPYSSSNAARLTFSMPLIDWGERKSNYLMSKSRREIVKYTTEQGIIDFDKNVVNTILEFNLQKKQLEISGRAEVVGKMGFDVTKQRFMIGKVDVLRLNEARNNMVSSRKGYIRTLESYWNYIYYIQKLTLFDFLNNQQLIADFEKIVSEQQF